MRKKVFLSLLFVFGLFSYIFSQETANLGELQGEVVWRGKDKIGIIFKKGPEGEEEILLPIDNQTTFEHIKKIRGFRKRRYCLCRDRRSDDSFCGWNPCIQ